MKKRREIRPLPPHEDPATCLHVWERHMWDVDPPKMYCPYCTTEAPIDGVPVK